MRNGASPAVHHPTRTRRGESDSGSRTPSTPSSIAPATGGPQPTQRVRKIKSQYPASSPERHVEYILVASFHIDHGAIMEHQYPGAISGDENMLAALMLPDQAHVRNQDWTIFFLHKDDDEEEEAAKRKAQAQKKRGKARKESASSEDNGPKHSRSSDVDTDLSDEETGEGIEEDDEDEEEEEGGEGPPLIYVLNLVNTKQDISAKRCISPHHLDLCHTDELPTIEVQLSKQWLFVLDILFYTYTR